MTLTTDLEVVSVLRMREWYYRGSAWLSTGQFTCALRSSLFWDVKERGLVVTDVSGHLKMGLIEFLYFVDRASLYNLFQMKPTRYTLLLCISISTSLHVSGNYVPIIRRTYCIYATLVFFTLYGWLSGRIDTVNSPDDGHIVAWNM